MRLVSVLAFAGLLACSCSGQQIAARISAEPILSPAEVAELEAAVRASPSQKNMRLRLLRHYMTSVPFRDGGRSPVQADRLAHIVYWIENYPSEPVSSSDLMYVPSENGPFADPADHAAVRNAWLRVVERLPNDANVLLNASRVLHREHPDDAEQMLSQVVDREPANRRIAANLGFLYALDILGVASPVGRPARPSDAERVRLGERARIELERSRNVFVLAGAGTALPNLFPHTEQARTPNGGDGIFKLASALMARARELGPEQAELQGPMPLITEFQEFQQGEVAQSASVPGLARRESSAPMMPSAIRVGGNVQAAKLVEKPEVVFPPLARQARIQGIVRFNVIVSPDGRVENATLVSGHPLLVPAATEAVRGYRYQPTLLNGVPVQVITQVDVPFTLAQ